MPKPIILHDNIPVIIMNKDFQVIGEATSLAKAARFCFLGSYSKIWRYLYKENEKRSPNRENGILSKITKQRYHFKLKQ